MPGKNMRWFDEEDFTSEHDKITIKLIQDGLTLLRNGLPNCPRIAKATRVEVKAEPILSGYPPLYPDAIIDVFTKLPGEYESKFRLIVEIKPKIESVGATLRQINAYMTRCHTVNGRTYNFINSPYRAEFGVPVLITTDSRYIDVFSNQGVRTILLRTEDLK